jgi:hypothetical protein
MRDVLFRFIDAEDDAGAGGRRALREERAAAARVQPAAAIGAAE